MLESVELQKLARDVARKNLPTVELEDVQAEAIVSSDGEDALRITLVFSPDSTGAISGDASIAILMAIHDALLALGDQRYPIIEYATSDDVPVEED